MLHLVRHLGLNVSVPWHFMKRGLSRLPDRVVELVRSCLCDCQRLENVTFSAASTLERICFESFLRTNIEALSIPDSVVELNKAIYDNCESSECCIR